MWTSRKTFERSLVDSNAEGERGTWTFVLTDSGLVTCTKSTSNLVSKVTDQGDENERGKDELNVQRICKICERSATRYHPLYQSH
jgi:hypothetical protein